MQLTRFGSVHPYKNFSELQSALSQSKNTEPPSYIVTGKKPGQAFSHAKLDGEEAKELSEILKLWTDLKLNYTKTGIRGSSLYSLVRKKHVYKSLNSSIRPFLSFFLNQKEITQNIQEGLRLNTHEEARAHKIDTQEPLTLESAMRAFLVKQIEPDVFFKLLISCVVEKMTGLQANLNFAHNFCKTDELGNRITQIERQSSELPSSSKLQSFEDLDEPLESSCIN